MMLDEKYKEIRDMVKKFSDSEVGPIAMKIDHDGQIPKALINKLSENGFLGSYVPEEFGGAGLDYMSYSLLVEEISRNWYFEQSLKGDFLSTGFGFSCYS